MELEFLPDVISKKQRRYASAIIPAAITAPLLIQRGYYYLFPKQVDKAEQVGEINNEEVNSGKVNKLIYENKLTYIISSEQYRNYLIVVGLGIVILGVYSIYSINAQNK